jgi:hypothetical protein
MNSKLVFLIVLLGLGNPSISQVMFYVESTEEEYDITPLTDPKIISEYLATIGAAEIAFNDNNQTSFDVPFKVKGTKGKWRLIADDYLGYEFRLGAYDSIGFPFYDGELENLLVVAKDRNKYGLFPVLEKGKKQLIYEQFVVTEVQTSYGGVLKVFLSKLDGKWGRIWHDGQVIESFLYSAKEDVPVHIWDDYEIESLLNLKKEAKLDRIIKVSEYVVKGRKAKSKKWGLYMGEGSFDEIVPPSYDSLTYHHEVQITEVWKGDKVGFYALDSYVTKDAIYEDFELIDIDYGYAVALKQNGRWQIYDYTEEGELLFEGSAATTQELLELWLNRFE